MELGLAIVSTIHLITSQNMPVIRVNTNDGCINKAYLKAKTINTLILAWGK